MTKINRRLFIPVFALMLSVLISGCNGKSSQTSVTTTEATTQTEATSSVADPAEPQKLFITVNGTDIRVGMKFSEVKKTLGAPKSESQVTACAGDAQEIISMYGALQIISSNDRITLISVDSENGDTSNMILGKKIKTGDTFDDVKSVFGNPTVDEEEFKTYRYGNTQLILCVYNNSIVSFLIMNNG